MVLLIVSVVMVVAVLVVVPVVIVGVVVVAVMVAVVVVVATVGVSDPFVVKLSLEFVVTFDFSVQQFLREGHCHFQSWWV